MKKYFLFLTLLLIQFVSVGTSKSEISEYDNEEVSVLNVNDAYTIVGPSSYSLNGSTSGVGNRYYLNPMPINATSIKWEITGDRGYIYPDGAYCSVNLYKTTRYTLTCVITINGVEEVAYKYITVMP